MLNAHYVISATRGLSVKTKDAVSVTQINVMQSFEWEVRMCKI